MLGTRHGRCELGEQVALFLKRPLMGQWTYLWLDATYLKVRDNGRVRGKAVVVAVGVTLDLAEPWLYHGNDSAVGASHRVHTLIVTAPRTR